MFPQLQYGKATEWWPRVSELLQEVLSELESTAGRSTKSSTVQD